MSRYIAGLWIALAVLVALPAAAQAIKSKASFAYNGKSVRVEMFRPSGQGPFPTVLVLHGASGVGQGAYVYPAARALAEAGVAAAVVHYYDGLKQKRRRDSPRIFQTRERIILAAVDYLAGRKDVRPDRMGVYGMSLGGFHALALAVQDKRIRSVVSLAGALSRHIPAKRLARMPPTLLLHGRRDRVVPFSRAVETARALKRYAGAGELKVYPKEGHVMSEAARRDALAVAVNFLVEGLRQGGDSVESAGR